MTKSAPATLGAEIVKRKGEASPSSASPPHHASAAPPSAGSTSTVGSRATSEGESAALPTKSMTVKVDVATYKKLKAHGVNVERSSQDIFIEALGLYFKAHKL